MKKFLLKPRATALILVMTLVSVAANAQTRTATANGPWNSTATWGGQSVPTASTNVNIGNFTVTVSSNAAAASITFTGAGGVTVNTGMTLNVTNGITLQNSNTSNRSAALAGAGTINCASVTIGNNATAPTSDRTTILTTTVSALNVSGDVLIKSEDNGNSQNDARFNLASGTITVGGTITLDADSDGGAVSTATLSMNTGAETATLSVTNNTPFANVGGGTKTYDFNGDNATVDYAGANQTVMLATYRNLSLTGGTKTLVNNIVINRDFTISGTSVTAVDDMSVGRNFSVASDAAFTATNNDFEVDGTATIDGTFNVTSINGDKAFGGLRINDGGVFNCTVNESFTISGNLQVNGSGSIISGGGTWTFNSTGSTLSGTGSATITNATFSAAYTNTGNYEFTNMVVNGGGSFNFTNNGTITSSSLTGGDGFTQGASGVLNYSGMTVGITNFSANTAGNIVNYNRAGNQTVRNVTYSNLVLSGSGVKTLAGFNVNALLSIQGTATTTGSTPSYATNAILEYKGDAAQTTSNVEFGGTGTNPTNLRIDNANGVAMNASKSINGTLTLTNGYLTTSNSTLLTIAANGNATTANGAFVNGPLAKVKNTTALFTFPVGSLGRGLRPVGVTPQSTTTTTFRATFVDASPKAAFSSNIGALSQISNCEYWDVSRTSGSANARVTLSWNQAGSNCGGTWGYVGEVTSLVVAHYTGGAWVNAGRASSTGTAAAGGTITSSTYMTSFSPFTLGTTNVNANPLPVLFADVKAFQKNNGVQIEWSNLTEKDLQKYQVERSANGQSFTAVINEQSPKSNNNDKASYTAFDASPLSGVNYYRVKAYELDGKVVYSKILKVEAAGKQGSFTLYPNPVDGGALSIAMTAKQGQYTIQVINATGQQLLVQRLAHPGGSMTQTVELPSSVKPGVYNLVISGSDYREAKTFIVK